VRGGKTTLHLQSCFFASHLREKGGRDFRGNQDHAIRVLMIVCGSKKRTELPQLKKGGRNERGRQKTESAGENLQESVKRWVLGRIKRWGGGVVKSNDNGVPPLRDANTKEREGGGGKGECASKSLLLDKEFVDRCLLLWVPRRGREGDWVTHNWGKTRFYRTKEEGGVVG